MMMSITAVRTSDGSKVSTCNITGSKNTSGEISPNRWSPAQWLAQLVSTESTTSDQQLETLSLHDTSVSGSVEPLAALTQLECLSLSSTS